MAKKPILPEDLSKLVLVSDAQVSPDGASVLFARKTIDLGENAYSTQICMVDESKAVRQLTQGKASSTGGRWSPCGGKVLFTSKRESGARQFYLLDLSGGEAQRVSNLPEGAIGSYQWSPSGDRIAFTFREEDPQWTQAAVAERERKKASKPPFVTETAWYRLDGDGYFGDRRFALYVLDIATSEHRLVDSGCPQGSYPFDWSPDGSKIVFGKSMATNLFRDPEDYRLFVSDFSTTTQVSGQPAGTKEGVRWSPDGKLLAFIGNPNPVDHRGLANNRLYVMPAIGGEVRCLGESTDFDLMTSTLSDARDAGADCWLEWTPDSKSIFVSVGWQGANQLGRADVESGELEVLTSGNHVLTPSSISKNGRVVAATLGTPTRPAEVVLVRLAETSGLIEAMTNLNAGFVNEFEIAEPEEMWVDSTDGVKVHAWFIRPSNVDRSQPYPSVLEIHGGPQAQYGWLFFHEFQVLAAAGYGVVYSNVRGSKGYGEAWSRAIEGHWGSKDWEDARAVKDWMIAQPEIDAQRIGVMGGSYGGYLVNWIVTQTHDFKAAITDRCVSNLVSKSLNSDYPYHPGTYWKGEPYGDISDLWRDSPIAHFKGVNTPMLIVHSEGDLRCNIEQGEQVYTALQELGVPVRFVRYPKETSHGMSRTGPPDLRVHRLNEILAWCKRWLSASS